MTDSKICQLCMGCCCNNDGSLPRTFNERHVSRDKLCVRIVQEFSVTNGSKFQGFSPMQGAVVIAMLWVQPSIVKHGFLQRHTWVFAA